MLIVGAGEPLQEKEEECTMNRKCCGVQGRTWAILIAVLALVGAVSVLTGTKDRAAAQSPAVTSGKAEGAVSYARSLSLAFREAAQKVLPSVVMIEHSSPAERAQGNNDDDAVEPFGNLPPEFRRFFNTPNMPQIPRGTFSPRLKCTAWARV